jgi:predicted flap endonuclease-1-like 5' DNA nuclease
MAGDVLSKDQERLAKLWDAYEEQEREFNLALKKISELEKKNRELEKINATLKKVTEGRDREIRELEIKETALEEENSQFRPELERLESLYQDEKERYAKLFAITEELEEELETARTELEIRDRWFQKHFGQLESFNVAMKERAIMIRESRFTSPERVRSIKFERIDEMKSEEDAGEAEPAAEEPEAPAKVKFETVPDDEPEPGKDSDEGEVSASGTGGSLTDLELVDDELAGKLTDAGITDIAKLAGASQLDLAMIEGVSPTLARKIIQAAKDHQ